MNSCRGSASSENKRIDAEPASFGFIRTPNHIAVSGSGRFVAVNDEFTDARVLILLDREQEKVTYIDTGNKNSIVQAPNFSFDEKHVIVSIDGYDYFSGTQFWKIDLLNLDVTVFKWDERTYAASPTFVSYGDDFVYFRNLNDLSKLRTDIQLMLHYGLFLWSEEAGKEKQLSTSGWNEFNDLWPNLETSEILFRGVGESVLVDGRWTIKDAAAVPEFLLGIPTKSNTPGGPVDPTRYDMVPTNGLTEVFAISKSGTALISRDTRTPEQQKVPIWSPEYNDGGPRFLEAAQIVGNKLVYTPKNTIPRIETASFGGIAGISDSDDVIVIYTSKELEGRGVAAINVYNRLRNEQSWVERQWVFDRKRQKVLSPTRIISEVILK